MVELHWLKMAEVIITNWFSYLDGLPLSTFNEEGPQFSNQDSRLSRVMEKAKKTFYLAISKIT